MRKTTLGRIAPGITSGSRGWAGYYAENGALFLRMTNLPKEGVGLLLHDTKHVQLPRNFSEGKRTRVKKNDILISITAELGKIGFIEQDLGEAYVNQHIALVRIADASVCPKFLAYYLAARPQRILLNRMNDSGAKHGLNLTTISNFPLTLPPLHEQEAIADTLATWDQAIATTRRLIEAKERRLKGLMSELLKPGTKEKWDSAILGDLFEEVTDKVGSKELRPFSISAGEGFVSQEVKWGRNISGQQYTNYIHLRAGDFAYNKGNSKKYKCGCVYRLTQPAEIAVPNVFICFRQNSNKVHPIFYENFFKADYHAPELRKIITSGARSDGLLNVSKRDFFKITVPLPPLKTQEHASNKLGLVQREIDLLKTLLTKYEQQKRGLMQKLLDGEWNISRKEPNNGN